MVELVGELVAGLVDLERRARAQQLVAPRRDQAHGASARGARVAVEEGGAGQAFPALEPERGLWAAADLALATDGVDRVIQ